MTDKYNAISADLTAEATARVRALIDQLQAELPFLIALTPEGRSGLVYPGARGLEACGAMAQAIEAHPGLFPAAVVDPVELRRDLALAQGLQAIRDRLAGLLQAIDDTHRAAGSDAYRAALRAFSVAQVLMSQVPGLEAELAPFAAHLDRPARPA